MVRNKIENLSHAVILQLLNQFLQLFITADFRIQLIVVGNVISVGAASASLEDGRRINMRNAESVQISDEPPRIFKTKSGIELQTLGRERLGRSLFRGQSVQALRNAARFRGQNCWISSHEDNQTAPLLRQKTPTSFDAQIPGEEGSPRALC